MFVSKARAYQYSYLSGTPLWGRLLALPTKMALCWIGLPGKKHCSLEQTFANYGRKSSITLFHENGVKNRNNLLYFSTFCSSHDPKT
jgi:hypothetical protein